MQLSNGKEKRGYAIVRDLDELRREVEDARRAIRSSREFVLKPYLNDSTGQIDLTRRVAAIKAISHYDRLMRSYESDWDEKPAYLE